MVRYEGWVSIGVEMTAEEAEVFHRIGLEPRQKSLRRKYWIWLIVFAIVLAGLGILGPLDPESQSAEGPDTWGEYFILMGFLLFVLVMQFLPGVSRGHRSDDRRLVRAYAGVHRFTVTDKGLMMRHAGVEEVIEWGRIQQVEGGEECLVLVAGPGEVLTLLRTRVVEGDFDCFAAAVRRRATES